MDNYEMLGTIGEGTYGVVLRAKHTATGQASWESSGLARPESTARGGVVMPAVVAAAVAASR